jgi:hypothetical protein
MHKHKQAQQNQQHGNRNHDGQQQLLPTRFGAGSHSRKGVSK